MEELVPIKTIEELLAHPDVKRTGTLELSICDIVHFRLLRSDSLFQLVEKRLRQRDNAKFTGYAEVREAAEKALRGSSIMDKINACCTKRPEWLDVRQIIYSFELEVWMDMSYPNPWALKLYHEALLRGYTVTAPRIGPFTDTFHTLLKEKNGYELTKPAPSPDKMVRVLIGEHTFPGETGLHFQTEKHLMRGDAFAGDRQLSSQLVHGIMEKDLEDVSAREWEEPRILEHSLGYRLIGPTLLLLIQSLKGKEFPVSFHGAGRDLLTGLVDSLRAYWPWLPEVEPLAVAGNRYCIFQPADGANALLPANGAKRGDCLLEWPFDVPAELLLPAMELFMKGGFTGSSAAGIQAAAENFIREYAKMTRGLYLRLPMAPVIRQWCHYLLCPDEDVLKWAASDGRFPGFGRSRTPLDLHRQVNKGPWPTGSYSLAAGYLRWLALRSEARVPDIIEARIRYS